MCFSAIAVANTILDMAAKKNILDMSPMKLQKLIFLAHALYYKENGHGLILDPIEKWEYGPVVYDVYREFRGFGSGPITRYAQNADGSYAAIPTNRYDIHSHLDNVLNVFGSLGAWKLSELTHLPNTAWSLAGNNRYISDEDIMDGTIYNV